MIEIKKEWVGETIQSLIDNDGFSLVVDTENTLIYGVENKEAVKGRITLQNKDGGTFKSTHFNTRRPIEKAMIELEEDAKERLMKDEIEGHPLRELKRRFKIYQDKHFTNQYARDGRPKTYNGFELFEDWYSVDGIMIPAMSVSPFNAGNTIIKFSLLEKNSVLSTLGDIGINSGSYGFRVEEHITAILDMITDYLSEPLDVRRAELMEHKKKTSRFSTHYFYGIEDDYEFSNDAYSKGDVTPAIRIRRLMKDYQLEVKGISIDGRKDIRPYEGEYEVITTDDSWFIIIKDYEKEVRYKAEVRTYR